MAGICAVCGDPVCSECFQPLFNTVICSNHEALEDESEWELVVLYAANDGVDATRFFLDDQGIASLAVENEEGMVELYVPIEDKDETWAVLDGGETGDDMLRCDECKVFYSRVVGECPVCGKGSE
jgi:hypothetical protein